MQSGEARLFLEPAIWHLNNNSNNNTISYGTCSPFSTYCFKFLYLQTQLSLIITLWNWRYQHSLYKLKWERFSSRNTGDRRRTRNPGVFTPKPPSSNIMLVASLLFSDFSPAVLTRHSNNDWHSGLCLSSDDNIYDKWRGLSEIKYYEMLKTMHGTW